MENFEIGQKVETLCSLRLIGGPIDAHVNFGTVENVTSLRVYVRNEHGNVQKFSRVTLWEIPRVDNLTPCYVSVL